MTIKQLILALILFFSLRYNSSGQWIQKISGTKTSLTDVYFTNQDTGYAVGINTILRTLDGGESWQATNFGSNSFESVFFINSNCGFVAGFDHFNSSASIFKTIDGGLNWTKESLVSASRLNDIQFINEKSGFIVELYGSVLKTNDGGKSWGKIETGAKHFLQSIFFTDSLNGLVVGGFPGTPEILKTNDGGNTWIPISNTPATDFLQAIHFPSKNIGYIAGWNGQILKTINGGEIWTLQTPVANYGNLDVFFTDDSTGYIVGGEMAFAGIQKTTDGGKTWYSQNPNISAGLIGLHFPTRNTGFTVGGIGTILKTTNGGETLVENTKKESIQFNIFPNPFSDEIFIELPENINSDFEIAIYDIHRKLVFFKKEFKNTLDLSFLAQGEYIFVIKSKTNFQMRKIIKI